MKLRLLSRLALCGALMLSLNACALFKKKPKYAGMSDSDMVSGAPLPERTEGVSFTGANVDRSKFTPVHFGYDSVSVEPSDMGKLGEVAKFMKGSDKQLIIAVGVAATEFSVEFGIRVAGGTYWHVVPEVIGPLLERQSGLMHACEAETSLMMHLSPSSVRTERLAEAYGPGSTRVEGQPPGLLMRRSFQALSPSGVFGDARLATAAKGEKLLAAIADKLAETLANTKLWA